MGVVQGQCWHQLSEVQAQAEASKHCDGDAHMHLKEGALKELMFKNPLQYVCAS